MPLINQARKILSSRWLLIPLAVLIGFVGGLWAAFGYARPMVNLNWANKAATFVNIAAQIDSGDVDAARETARDNATVAVDSMVHNGAVGPSYNSYWQNVATYISLSPGMKFSREAEAVLTHYRPFTDSELKTSKCQSGVCTLARKRSKIGND